MNLQSKFNLLATALYDSFSFPHTYSLSLSLSLCYVSLSISQPVICHIDFENKVEVSGVTDNINELIFSKNINVIPPCIRKELCQSPHQLQHQQDSLCIGMTIAHQPRRVLRYIGPEAKITESLN